MIYRILYSTWKFFWTTVGVLLAAAVIIGGLAISALQLPVSKDYINNTLTSAFNEQFEGTVQAESLSGFLPFRAELNNVEFFAPGSEEYPEIKLNRLTLSVNLWQLFQKNIDVLTLDLDKPDLRFALTDEKLTIAQIFSPKESDSAVTLQESDDPIFRGFNLYAPRIRVIDGVVIVDNTITIPAETGLETPFSLSEINANLLFENTTSQLFIDLSAVSAHLSAPGYEDDLALRGQFFNDGQYLELNGIDFSSSLASFSFNGEAFPIDLFSGDLTSQARDANYRLDLHHSELHSDMLKRAFPETALPDQNLELQTLLSGTLDLLYADRFELTFGQSSILADGQLENITGNDFSYQMQLENVVLDPNETGWFADHYAEGYNIAFNNIAVLRGTLDGTRNHLHTKVELQTGSGDLNLDGEINFAAIPEYELLMVLDSLDLSPFTPDTSFSTRISGLITAQGSGFDSNASLAASLHLLDGHILDYPFTRTVAEIEYSDKQLSYSGRAELDNSEFSTSGRFGMDDGYITLITNGFIRNINLKDYFPALPYERAVYNGRYSASLEGKELDDFFGRFSAEITNAVINDDTLRAHQLYFDIDNPDRETRNLRFTSSFFDAELSGTIKPTNIAAMGRHWLGYLRERVNEEILFGDDLLFSIDEPPEEDYKEFTLDLNALMRIKDLKLLRIYLPDLPHIKSSARITASANATGQRLSLSANITDNDFAFEESAINDLNSAFSATFDYGQSLRQKSLIDFQVSGNNVQIGDNFSFSEAYVNMSMRNDTINVEQQFGNPLNDVNYTGRFNSVLKQDRFEINADTLQLTIPGFQWSNIEKPKFVFTDQHKVEVSDFVISSGDDLVQINGIFSTDFDDTVSYKIKDFNLAAISDLTGGRIQFSGIVNGDFTTRSLTEAPSIQGDLYVDDGRINGRIVGDVTLNSEFNQDLNRFDTKIHVYTDPGKYASYLEENNNNGHDLFLEGFFNVPATVQDGEDIFYFDADLRQIDMWIVTLIVPTVVIDMEGRSSGSGFVRAGLDDFDFSATFDIEDVYGVPIFMNVGYNLQGELVFNKMDGLLFNDIMLEDGDGGTGRLYGQIDLDQFSPTNRFDLNLDLQNLRFMNNPPDREVPFTASLYGTGAAQLSGTNLDPLIRTTQAITLSNRSRVTIPLREETEFEQDRRFIQFVDSFDIRFSDPDDDPVEIGNGNGNDQPDLTFIELFTMDLQFIANNPINVELLFDPVTNEVLNSTGTGQLRILLEDQDISMFGRFNIQGGEYQFVGGDILTRRFSLREGGNITWQGNLEEATLNVTAAYRARPDISTLIPSMTALQRVPIELILQIGGTINAIENDFYFTVPTGIEGTVDPTVSTQINTLNQNEDEKILQAFAILLTGNFIPSDQAQTMGIGENITGTTALVNPLIGSQIISPLLSNQINSLLNSDIVFDVDVNVTRNRVAGEEGDEFGVDLDVALRLFDDRIILRREGQIAGQQSNIGDLGATYRINRILSVTAFHRQDPTLAARTETDSQQTQEMNGLGLEAQFQFNTWKSLRIRFSNSVKRLFGISVDETKDDTVVIEPLAGS